MCLATNSSITEWRISAMVSSTASSRIKSSRCSKITLRWSFITSSYLSRFLRMSQLRASTFCCAFSSALLIHGWTIASFSFSPSFCNMPSSLSEPKMRIALAKLLLEKPNLLLLDEPTNHLDLEARNWLEEYLAAYPYAYVLVSHDRYFLDVTVRKIVELTVV